MATKKSKKKATSKKSKGKRKSKTRPLKANPRKKPVKTKTSGSRAKAKVKSKTAKKKSTQTAKIKTKKKAKKATKAKTRKKITKAKKSKKAKPTKKPKSLKVVKGKPKAPNPTLQKIRQRLIQERQELYNILQSSKELERNVSELNFSNEIDLAASLEGREMAFQLSSRDRNELKLIEEALFRILAGTYGVCQSCSKTIGLKRLKIMPLTTHCINCQETMERPS